MKKYNIVCNYKWRRIFVCWDCKERRHIESFGGQYESLGKFLIFLSFWKVIEDVEDLWRLTFDWWHDVKMTSIIKRESLQSWPRILHYVLVIHNAVSLYKYFTLSSKFCNHYFCIQIAWCFLERIYKRKSIWNWKYRIKYFHLNVFE